WHPFIHQPQYHLAEFLFRQNETPQDQIDDLMDIWASMPECNGSPPFANHADLYSRIDAIRGDPGWQCFSVKHANADTLPPLAEDSSVPAWKHASYDLWFRNPESLANYQLSMPDFKDHIDYAPCQVFGDNHQRVWSDLMIGNWAWRQSKNELANNPANHGAMFAPLILGSDKTTVSVATGNNEYYPIYLSVGNLHSNVRHAHGEGISLLGFLAIPKTDRKHENDQEFRDFRRHLFHTSLTAIFETMRPAMIQPKVKLCPDGHYRRIIYGLGPYIADYPEQVLLSCIVQGWCPICLANRKDLDGSDDAGPCTHEHSKLLMQTFASDILWKEYGLIDNILPFTASFPRANIHELIAPDILHQIIKGTFKDHIVAWIETYLELTWGETKAKAIMADIDRRIAAAPPFPGLRRFPEGRKFKQWTGDDSKALMKVFLPAIVGLVPDRMVQAVSAFMDFCYIVRRSSLDEGDLNAMQDALERFETNRTVFVETGVQPNGISIPRIHSLKHYQSCIQEFGAPNGLCSSITESKHIRAVKRPWRRSNHYKALGQMLVINQRLDKLAYFRANRLAEGIFSSKVNKLFKGLLNAPLLPNNVEAIPLESSNSGMIGYQDDSNLHDAEDIEGEKTESMVTLAQTPSPCHIRTLSQMGEDIQCPDLPDLVACFLYDQRNPDAEVSGADVDISKCPRFLGKGYSYSSALATFYAPSDLCGVGGMYCQHIHARPSWRGGHKRYDCVFAEKDPTLLGFQGLYVAQVFLLFSFQFRNTTYPCALVHWFSPIGNEPCPNTGMWMVEPEFEENGNPAFSVIHLDSVMRPAHLIGIYGTDSIPYDLDHHDSLSAFAAFYVNKFSDYHAHSLAF
ncbi:hypothetical protein PAXINDRAFT_72399, partial [Paxillus involutus ATCC 200175]